MTRNLDTLKKWMTCLGCGKKLWTDRCHRLCAKCRRRNEKLPARSPYYVAPGVMREMETVEP